MIDSLVASRSKIFFGCWFSTFLDTLIDYAVSEMGYHSSYYYALDDRKYHIQEFYPVMKSFYAREFPTAWRLIDEGIQDLAQADATSNAEGAGASKAAL